MALARSSKGILVKCVPGGNVELDENCGAEQHGTQHFRIVVVAVRFEVLVEHNSHSAVLDA
jgi:stress-induced morphogen